MMVLIRNTIRSSLLAVLLMSVAGLSSASGEGGLVEKMRSLQYFMHKTGLSLQAKNLRLASFYVHELEETIEELEAFGSYKKHAIGRLVEEILLPDFERLEKQLGQGSTRAQWQAYLNVIDSCNRCHRATEHDFIIVEFNDNNPYLQSFEK